MPASGSRSSIPMAAFWATVLAVLCLPGSTLPTGDASPVLARRAGLNTVLDTQVHFGTLADDDGSVEIGTTDNVVSDPDHLFVDPTVFSGVIDVTGDANAAVSITIVGGSATGLSLSHFVTSEGTPPLTSVFLDGDGFLRLRIGARLTVDREFAIPGEGREIEYTVTILYE